MKDELVILPVYVAEWFEKQRMSFSLIDIYKTIATSKIPYDVIYWLASNTEDSNISSERLLDLAKAYNYGYEVKETLYSVILPTGQNLYKNKVGEKVNVVIKFCKKSDPNSFFTEKEIEDAGFSWVFEEGFAEEVEVL